MGHKRLTLAAIDTHPLPTDICVPHGQYRGSSLVTYNPELFESYPTRTELPQKLQGYFKHKNAPHPRTLQ